MDELHEKLLENLSKEPQFFDVAELERSFFCKGWLLVKMRKSLEKLLGTTKEPSKVAQKVSVFQSVNEHYFENKIALKLAQLDYLVQRRRQDMGEQNAGILAGAYGTMAS